MEMILGWRPSPFVTEVAATASGGDTMAPKRKLSGQLMFGINVWAATPTNKVVNSTKPNAASEIGLMLALNCCQLVFHAAAYNKGGRKIKKTIEGSSLMTGMAGTRLITTPQTTSTTGKENLYLLLNMPRKVTPNNKKTIRPMFPIMLISAGKIKNDFSTGGENLI